MSAGAATIAPRRRGAIGWRTLSTRMRSAAWLGWQIECNWTDPFTFVVYAVMRPLANALILAGIFWAVSGQAARRETFLLFYVANAFHEYVTRLVVGMGWVVVEEREDYETIKYVHVSPIGMLTYLAGRSTVKLALATVSVLLTLTVGWFAFGLRWDWGQVRWLLLLLSSALGILASVNFGILVAGFGLLLPRIAITLNEGLAVAFYLLCGVIFPVDLLPRGLRELSLAFPFTYWYEAVRRSLAGRGASDLLSGWSDLVLFGALAATTAVFVAISLRGYAALERRARKLGRLDQTSLF